MTHLVHVFSTFGPGGPQVRFVGLVPDLPAHYEHTVLATNNEFSCQARLPPGARVKLAETPRRPGEGVRRGEFSRLLRGLRPDLLLTYNWGATDALWVSLLRPFAPILHTEESFGPDEVKRQYRRRVWARRLVLRAAVKVVVPSRSLETVAIRDWWVPPSRVAYVPNGVDTRRVAPGDGTPFRVKYGIPAGIPVVGTVAHLRPEKNVGLLLRAFAAAAPKESRLVIVGDGVDRTALESLAAHLDIASRVTFTGYLDNPAEALRAFDVFALTSDTEQMPIAILEAMSMGLPCVATDAGDVKLMLSEANIPFVVPRGDAVALARSLTSLLSDRPRALALGAANRARCERDFDASRTNALYSRLYEETLENVKR